MNTKNLDDLKQQLPLNQTRIETDRELFHVLMKWSDELSIFNSISMIINHGAIK